LSTTPSSATSADASTPLVIRARKGHSRVSAARAGSMAKTLTQFTDVSCHARMSTANPKTWSAGKEASRTKAQPTSSSVSTGDSRCCRATSSDADAHAATPTKAPATNVSAPRDGRRSA